MKPFCNYVELVCWYIFSY